MSSITFTFVGTEVGHAPGTGYSLVGGLRNTVESYSPFMLKKKGKAAGECFLATNAWEQRRGGEAWGVNSNFPGGAYPCTPSREPGPAHIIFPTPPTDKSCMKP